MGRGFTLPGKLPLPTDRFLEVTGESLPSVSPTGHPIRFQWIGSQSNGLMDDPG